MPPAEALLPYVIDLWTADEDRIEQVLATAASVTIARMAFDAAAVTFPDRYLTLTGPGVEEEWRPRARRLAEEFGTGKGWTTEPSRLENSAVR